MVNILSLSVLRNFLLYSLALAALVNAALTPIPHNLRFWIELIFLLFQIKFTLFLLKHMRIYIYALLPFSVDFYMWFNSGLPIIKYSYIGVILLFMIDVFKLNLYVCVMLIRVNPCQLSSIQSISWENKYHSHVSYLCFVFIGDGQITWGMIIMMIRHTAQSGIVQPALLLRRRIYLSRYPLLFLLARPSCVHYHNSDISLFFFSFFFSHRLYSIL